MSLTEAPATTADVPAPAQTESTSISKTRMPRVPSNVFIVKPQELAAVALAASTEETRYYLGGVFFERYKTGDVGLIATDGHRLHSTHAQIDGTVVSSFIMRSDDIEQALTLAKIAKKAYRMLEERIAIVVTHKNGKLAVNVGLVDKGESKTTVETGRFETKPIDGTFPDWRRVLPTIDPEEASSEAGFNADYLADFGKAGALLAGSSRYKGIKIELGAAGAPARITVGTRDSNFFGVLMPMRV